LGFSFINSSDAWRSTCDSAINGAKQEFSQRVVVRRIKLQDLVAVYKKEMKEEVDVNEKTNTPLRRKAHVRSLRLRSATNSISWNLK
jgi:hypothetical protein